MNEFEDYVKRIEREYLSLGHQLGWRFLTSPRRMLAPSTRTLLLSANPGGDRIPPDHPTASCEMGVAYVVESWAGYPPGQAPLQRQVQRMFGVLGEDLKGSLGGYLVPFRSPSFESLPEQDKSIRFGVGLWRSIFSEISPTLVICLGKETFQHARSVWPRQPRIDEMTVGWGAQTALVAKYPERVVLALPHLSRFKLFGRPESQEPIERIFAQVHESRRAVESSFPTS